LPRRLANADPADLFLMGEQGRFKYGLNHFSAPVTREAGHI
jgi:hypothetical protein